MKVTAALLWITVTGNHKFHTYIVPYIAEQILLTLSQHKFYINYYRRKITSYIVGYMKLYILEPCTKNEHNTHIPLKKIATGQSVIQTSACGNPVRKTNKSIYWKCKNLSFLMQNNSSNTFPYTSKKLPNFYKIKFQRN